MSDDLAGLPSCIPRAIFLKYREYWENELADAGIFISLRPGDRLQPCKWSLPSYPSANLFWPFGIVIVDLAFHSVFASGHFTGANFQPVAVQRIGANAVTALIPDDVDEPNDAFERVPYLSDVSRFQFFEMVIESCTAKDKYDVPPKDSCSACGYQDVFDSIDLKRRFSSLRKKRLIPQNYICDEDVFKCQLYNPGIIVKPHVLEALRQVPITNCQIQELSIVPD
jgi:hypothetical protein